MLNPKKKAILQSDPLLTRLVNANIMLCYLKAEDGVADGDGIKYRAVKRMLGKPYEKAKAQCPELAERLKRFVSEQSEIERNKTDSVDRAADAFAGLMRDLPELITGQSSSDELKGLCYNIGKFVYLADALDDIADDRKKKAVQSIFMRLRRIHVAARVCTSASRRAGVLFLRNMRARRAVLRRYAVYAKPRSA